MLTKSVQAFANAKNLKNLLIYGFGQVFNLVTPLLVVPYIVFICGIENYGKVSIGMAISFFLMVFIDYGSDIVNVREVAINREDSKKLEKIFVTTFLAKLVMLLVVMAVASIIFCLVPFFKKETALFFLGISVLVGQFLNPTWFLQGLENFKSITVATIVSKVVYLVLIFLFITKKSDYIYINLFWGAGSIIANGIMTIFIMKKNSFSLRSSSKSEIILFLSSNFNMFFSQIFVSMQMYAPIMLIGFFGNNLMAGYYKIVEQIIVVFKTYIFLFFNFVYPRVCFLMEKKWKEGLIFWKKYNGLNFLFIAMCMLIINFFTAPIVRYFTEKDVEIIIQLLRIATLLPILLAVSIPLKQLLLALNMQQIYVRLTMVLVVVNLLAIVLLIPIYEIYGVFYSLIAIELCTIVTYSIYLKIKFKTPDIK